MSSPTALPDPIAYLDVTLRVAVRMNLVRRPAHVLETQRLFRVLLRRGVPRGARVGGHALAASAEQPVDGQARHLAGDVPQRDVDRAYGVGGHRPVFLPHLTPDRADIQGVATQQAGLHDLHQRAGVGVGPLTGRAKKRVALHALVRAHRQHAKQFPDRRTPSPRPSSTARNSSETASP